LDDVWVVEGSQDPDFVESRFLLLLAQSLHVDSKQFQN
jgi:hypothetical protein